jgi:transcriptional regulator with XRE-family HTH domain
MEDAMQVEVAIGPAIRDMRRERGLTLTTLAEACDLSPSHISQIERGITSPSLSTLRHIAEALGIRLSQLILAAEPLTLSADRYVSRQKDRIPACFPGTNIQYQLIGREGSSLQLLSISAPPGEGMEQHERTSPGEECGIVLSGRMRVTIEDSEATLGPGDAVFIQSLLEHGWENAGTEDLRVIWAITPSLAQLALWGHLGSEDLVTEGEP